MESRTSPGKKGSVQPISGCQGPPLGFAWLGYPDSPDGFWVAPFPVPGVNLFGHDKTLLRRYGLHSVYACRFLATVFLCHPPHCQEPSCFGFQQEFLQFLYYSCLPTLTGSVDALLDAVDMLLQLAPGQLVPSLTHGRDVLRVVAGCFPICHRTDSLPSIQQCRRQHILWLSQRRWLLRQS